MLRNATLLIGVLQKSSVANKILFKIDEINFPKFSFKISYQIKKTTWNFTKFFTISKKYIPTLGEMTSESALCN